MNTILSWWGVYTIHATGCVTCGRLAGLIRHLPKCSWFILLIWRLNYRIYIGNNNTRVNICIQCQLKHKFTSDCFTSQNYTDPCTIYTRIRLHMISNSILFQSKYSQEWPHLVFLFSEFLPDKLVNHLHDRRIDIIILHCMDTLMIYVRSDSHNLMRLLLLAE